MSIMSFVSSQIKRLIFKREAVVGVKTESLEESIDVYNIEVEETHNYFSSFLTHNCDDIVSEKEIKAGNPEAYESAWTWFLTGPLQRLQPSGRIVVIGTRWSKADPIGKIKRRMKTDPENSDKYESIEFTALDENDESNFPEIWPTAELIAKRNNTIPQLWNAQYMQNPTTAAGAIVSKEMWRKWDRFTRVKGTNEVDFDPPECFLTLMSLDTAFTKNKRSNPTAMTVWGCFNYVDPHGSGEEIPCIILLYSEKRKMEFDELKKQCKIWNSEWNPDVILIEEKSSGPMLRSELNAAGIMVTPVLPKPREDKVSRLNSVAPIFASKRVWYIPTFANEACVDEVNDFPNGDEDDFTDSTAYAVRYLRRTGMVGAEGDAKFADEETERRSRYGD